MWTETKTKDRKRSRSPESEEEDTEAAAAKRQKLEHETAIAATERALVERELMEHKDLFQAAMESGAIDAEELLDEKTRNENEVVRKYTAVTRPFEWADFGKSDRDHFRKCGKEGGFTDQDALTEEPLGHVGVVCTICPDVRDPAGDINMKHHVAVSADHVLIDRAADKQSFSLLVERTEAHIRSKHPGLAERLYGPCKINPMSWRSMYVEHVFPPKDRVVRAADFFQEEKKKSKKKDSTPPPFSPPETTARGDVVVKCLLCKHGEDAKVEASGWYMWRHLERKHGGGVYTDLLQKYHPHYATRPQTAADKMIVWAKEVKELAAQAVAIADDIASRSATVSDFRWLQMQSHADVQLDKLREALGEEGVGNVPIGLD